MVELLSVKIVSPIGGSLSDNKYTSDYEQGDKIVEDENNRENQPKMS